MERHLAAAQLVQNARKFMDAYGVLMTPMCQETGMPRTALDILLFLANNQGYDTAGDICRYRGLKPGIVSMHVETLVREGLLERQNVPGDRRKTRLALTDKARDLVSRGRAVQREMAQQMMEGLTREDIRHFCRCLEVFDQNLDRIRQGAKRSAAYTKGKEGERERC